MVADKGLVEVERVVELRWIDEVVERRRIPEA